MVSTPLASPRHQRCGGWVRACPASNQHCAWSGPTLHPVSRASFPSSPFAILGKVCMLVCIHLFFSFAHATQNRQAMGLAASGGPWVHDSSGGYRGSYHACHRRWIRYECDTADHHPHSRRQEAGNGKRGRVGKRPVYAGVHATGVRATTDGYCANSCSLTGLWVSHHHRVQPNPYPSLLVRTLGAHISTAD